MIVDNQIFMEGSGWQIFPAKWAGNLDCEHNWPIWAGNCALSSLIGRHKTQADVHQRHSRFWGMLNVIDKFGLVNK